MLWFSTCLCTKSQWWWLRFTGVRWWTRLIYWMEKAKHSTTEGLLSGLSGRNLSWILAVVSQWLRTNARTAVWSNMLVWLEKQWKVIRAIESRLETPPCAVNNKARQWGNKAPVVWGIRRYGLWATGLKNLMRGNAELYKVPDHQG